MLEIESILIENSLRQENNMSNFNKVMIIGNLTRDPRLSYTPSQTAVVEIGIAVNRQWTSQDGSKKEETCFIDCKGFGRTAETLSKYLSKGQPIFIEGRLTYENWTAQDGSKRSKHAVVIERFQFLGGGEKRETTVVKDEGGDDIPDFP